MIALFVTLITIGLVSADCSGDKCDDGCRVTTFLANGDYECSNGRDGGKYTLNIIYTSNQKCELQCNRVSSASLTWHKSNGERVVNNLVVLEQSLITKGDTFVGIAIYHVTSGNLVGKYVMRREEHKMPYYLKTCSTVLGNTSTKSISADIIINSKLDLLSYISPHGKWDDFKRGSSAVCTGLIYHY